VLGLWHLDFHAAKVVRIVLPDGPGREADRPRRSRAAGRKHQCPVHHNEPHGVTSTATQVTFALLRLLMGDSLFLRAWPRAPFLAP
jgi:hypothetical protein